jgi:hypothetical protein
VKIQRKSRLDPFVDRIGVLPDREVAALAGVTPENVRAWRVRRDVPAGWRKPAARAPDAVPVPLPAPEPAPAHGRAGRRPSTPRPLAAAAWLVTVERDGGAEEFVVLAGDVTGAADRAMERLALPPGGGGHARILSLTYLAEALLG